MTEEERQRAMDEGTEADAFLKQFFLWYYAGSSYYTAEAQVFIPNSSVNPEYRNGFCDLLLYDDYAAQIYELKKYTNDNAKWHSKDVNQLDSYIKHYQDEKGKDTMRGIIFNPTGLLIQSELNPQYYIQYYTHYNKTHILLDPETGYAVIDSKTGRPKIENYEGFIYWKYVEIEYTNPLPYTVWIRNTNGKGGEFQTSIQNRMGEQAQQDLGDDIAAATALIIVGGILWFGAKIVLSGYGQWWVWACP